MNSLLFASMLINLILIFTSCIFVKRIGGWRYVVRRGLNGSESMLYAHRVDHFDRLPRRECAVVMLGDSLTEQAEWQELFSRHDVINRGISGDTTKQLSGRLADSIKSQPHSIFLMVGINDLFRDDPESVAVRYRDVVNTIRNHAPDTILHLCSVLPINRSVRWIPIEPTEIEMLNDCIQTIAERECFEYIDVASVMKDGSGSLRGDFTSDGIHLNGRGYEAWASQLKPYLPE